MPFKSKAQQRWMFAAEARGEVPKGTARRWAHETPSIKKLPEHVKKSSENIAWEVLRKLATGTPSPVSLTTQAPKAAPVPHAATAEAPPQAGDQLTPNESQKAAATLSPSGGGPAPKQLGGQIKPNQLQDNLTSGSTLGLQTPPPPAGPGVGSVTASQSRPIANTPNSTQTAREKGANGEIDPHIKAEAKNFLRSNPNPDDSQVHSWAEANNYDKEQVEDAMYQLATERVKMSSVMLAQMQKLAYVRIAAERIPGGKAEGKDPSQFAKSEKRHAREVESEHSPDPEVQEEIGRDHNVEHPRYYADWLLPMEKIMKKRPDASLWDYVKLKNAGANDALRKLGLDAEELLGQGEQRKQDVHEQQLRFEEEKHQLDMQKQQLEMEQMQQRFELEQQQAQADTQVKQQQMQIDSQTKQQEAQAKVQAAQNKADAAAGPPQPPPDPQQQYRQNIMMSQGGGQPQQ